MKEQGHFGREMLRVTEVADALGLTRVAVWAAIRRGEIPALRIGRAYLIPRSALAKLLTVGPAAKDKADGHARS